MGYYIFQEIFLRQNTKSNMKKIKITSDVLEPPYMMVCLACQPRLELAEAKLMINLQYILLLYIQSDQLSPHSFTTRR